MKKYAQVGQAAFLDPTPLFFYLQAFFWVTVTASIRRDKRTRNEEVALGKIGATIPDLFYDDPIGGTQLAICLDGLSKGIHGNKNQQQLDRMLRERLEEEGIDVIEIATADLDDPAALKRHFKRISMKLRRR